MENNGEKRSCERKNNCINICNKLAIQIEIWYLYDNFKNEHVIDFVFTGANAKVRCAFNFFNFS